MLTTGSSLFVLDLDRPREEGRGSGEGRRGGCGDRREDVPEHFLARGHRGGATMYVMVDEWRGRSTTYINK